MQVIRYEVWTKTHTQVPMWAELEAPFVGLPDTDILLKDLELKISAALSLHYFTGVMSMFSVALHAMVQKPVLSRVCPPAAVMYCMQKFVP